MVSPIRCPECGLVNHPDDVMFPHCGQCHELLVRCSSCRHHEGSGCRHPRAYVRYTADGDAAKTCPEFHARTEVRSSRMLALLPAPLWVSALLFLILACVMLAAWFIDPLGRYFHGNPLRVETAIPREVVAGEPFTVTMRLTNLLDRPSTHIYVEIDDSFLRSVNWANQPSPHPSHIAHQRHKLILEYEPLPPGGQCLLEYPLIPRGDEIAPFSARVYSPSNQLRHTLNVPIQVAQGIMRDQTGGAYQ